MHILFFTHNYPPEVNAAASRVSERAHYWLAWGHKVTVITSNPHFPQGKLYAGYKNKWYQVEDCDGVRVVRVKTLIAGNKGVIKRILSFMFYMIMAIIAGFFEKKSDVVIATSPQFFTAIAGCIVGAIKRKHFIFELGDLWPASLSAVGIMQKNFLLKFIEKIELLLYRKSSHIIALTQSFKDNLISRGVCPDKITVVINGVEMSKYSPVEKHEQLIKQLKLSDKFVIGYIGTHGMAHALENVLTTAEMLQETKVKFMFVGDGSAREGLLARAKQLDLTNVDFIPAQPKNIIADFWSVCDIALVHLKDAVAFESVIPSKIFEAMGMGLPILLVAPTGEASRIILAEEAGTVVPAGHPEMLKEEIECLLMNREKLKRYADCSAKAARHYTREKQAADMLDVIKHVVTEEDGVVEARP